MGSFCEFTGTHSTGSFTTDLRLFLQHRRLVNRWLSGVYQASEGVCGNLAVCCDGWSWLSTQLSWVSPSKASHWVSLPGDFQKHIIPQPPCNPLMASLMAKTCPVTRESTLSDCRCHSPALHQCSLPTDQLQSLFKEKYIYCSIYVFSSSNVF